MFSTELNNNSNGQEGVSHNSSVTTYLALITSHLFKTLPTNQSLLLLCWSAHNQISFVFSFRDCWGICINWPTTLWRYHTNKPYLWWRRTWPARFRAFCCIIEFAVWAHVWSSFSLCHFHLQTCHQRVEVNDTDQVLLNFLWYSPFPFPFVCCDRTPRVHSSTRFIRTRPQSWCSIRLPRPYRSPLTRSFSLLAKHLVSFSPSSTDSCQPHHLTIHMLIGMCVFYFSPCLVWRWVTRVSAIK